MYANLSYPERPLLIIGFRQRRNENELKLLGSLSGQSIAVRSDATAPLPDVGSNNVLILNTSGELLKMYALANLAIVGHDRNIFEPASQKAAVLYFKGSWTNNREAMNALAPTGAAEVFTKESLERLLNMPADTIEMGEKGSSAVEEYRRQVRLGAEEFILQIIGARPALRNKLIQDNAQAAKIINKTQLSKKNHPVPPKDTGGIDLTSANMNLQTQNNGGEIKFHIDPAMLAQLQNAPGFVPVIISIQPMSDLKSFLLNNSP